MFLFSDLFLKTSFIFYLFYLFIFY